MGEFKYVLGFMIPAQPGRMSYVCTTTTNEIIDFMKANISNKYLYVEMYEKRKLPSGHSYFQLFRRWNSIEEFLTLMREYNLCIALEAQQIQ